MKILWTFHNYMRNIESKMFISNENLVKNSENQYYRTLSALSLVEIFEFYTVWRHWKPYQSHRFMRKSCAVCDWKNVNFSIRIFHTMLCSNTYKFRSILGICVILYQFNWDHTKGKHCSFTNVCVYVLNGSFHCVFHFQIQISFLIMS